MSKNNCRTLEIPILARVEGEGALAIEINDGKIHSLQLKIFEPPRLFEKFLEGRGYQEVLDIVARICGICPVAYQMSAAHAIEACFSSNPGPWVREMRRLFYCGEWLESHSLHIHFLAAPDFLGFDSGIEMAKHHGEVIQRGLRIQAFGNALVSLLGGRSVHPVGACVGGFYAAPSKSAVTALLAKTQTLLEDAEALMRWVASIAMPDNSHEFTYVALRHPSEYPMNEGRIVTSQGLNLSIDCFDQYFKESQVSYSTALHCLLQGKPYLVGPLARVNLNYDTLPTRITTLIEELGYQFPSNNMYHSMMARAIEIYYCLIEAQRLLAHYDYPKMAAVPVIPSAGVGYGCTEAPRGLLWHRFEINASGQVINARIVPPTSQNQARIEEDLTVSLYQFGLDKTDNLLLNCCEKIIRNYDPCISCSTHFLNLSVSRK